MFSWKKRILNFTNFSQFHEILCNINLFCFHLLKTEKKSFGQKRNLSSFLTTPLVKFWIHFFVKTWAEYVAKYWIESYLAGVYKSFNGFKTMVFKPRNLVNINVSLWAFHPIFVTWFLVVFGGQVTKILHNIIVFLTNVEMYIYDSS